MYVQCIKPGQSVSKMAGSFECEFAEKVSKGIQLECPICLLILREPYQATCYGKTFCKECIYRVRADLKPCLTCKDVNFKLFYNKELQQSLYDFRVSCTHKSKGCEGNKEQYRNGSLHESGIKRERFFGSN